jgi:hypothetical protein
MRCAFLQLAKRVDLLARDGHLDGPALLHEQQSVLAGL